MLTIKNATATVTLDDDTTISYTGKNLNDSIDFVESVLRRVNDGNQVHCDSRDNQ